MTPLDKREAKFESVLNWPLRVLVTDDDPIMREFASVYLGSENAIVVTAASGEDGLRALDAQTFDILMLDIYMPGMSGYDVLKVLRNSHHAKLPVVVVTSNEDIASIDHAFLCGASSFVTKPVNWHLLAYQLRFVSRQSRSCPHCLESGG